MHSKMDNFYYRSGSYGSVYYCYPDLDLLLCATDPDPLF
jgi:hypothetical protein